MAEQDLVKGGTKRKVQVRKARKRAFGAARKQIVRDCLAG